MQLIDFVIPWVDGNDPEWRRQKDNYAKNVTLGNEPARFREWDELKYVFRGIEKNAPWVNKVHFITCGHLPKWLNTSHPKLNIVRHSDYIPKEYLPTFSSRPIELNIHRIQGLSEQFVYLNDDFFMVRPLRKTDFFVNGIPRAMAGIRIVCGEWSPYYESTLFADLSLIRRHFNNREVLSKNFWKFINPRYGVRENLCSIALLPYCWHLFPGFVYSHGPNAYLKSTLEEVWLKEEKKLSETSMHKFRSFDDVNQQIFLWWQCCKGNFIPTNTRRMLNYISVQSSDEMLTKTITGCDRPFLVVNDVGELTDDAFKRKKRVIKNAFDRILGKKSGFEL